MTTQNTQTPMFDMQSLFNPKSSHELFKTMASMNERMTAIFVEAGTRSVEIMTATAKQSLSNLSEVAQVREEPADYAKAYSEFAQKQMDLLKRSAQDIGEVTQEAGTETQELTSELGEEVNGKVAASTKEATEKFSANAKEASERLTSSTEEATDKFKSVAKDAAYKGASDKTSSAFKKSS
ncbi:phasin family protein [Sulfitobacter aestuarii]|uniref:Phasin family protein n=1 Tax=Sulfitobacter aestuarii TaxID=2161676 RepID=A0ABW5U1E5_9RHOB